MSLRFAFIGFRHNHILSLHRLVAEMGEAEIVAACEENVAARAEAVGNGVEMTHPTVDDLLSDARCDVVAIGDYFARRGSLVLQALSAGKHVMVDKPLSTSLDELDQIEGLAKETGLKVGCMLTMRGSAQIIGARELIRGGVVGEIHAIAFGGQHPLNRDSRAAWYFEPGKHGGTINDIAVHALDAIPWITGRNFATLNAARCWNALAPDVPHFHDGAQMMLTMDNGCGVLGDVSYFLPSPAGYSLPFYWRMTFFGRCGILETSATAESIVLALEGAEGTELRPLPPEVPGAYLASFIRDIEGGAREDDLDTASVLRATRLALTVQRAADENAHDVPL